MAALGRSPWGSDQSGGRNGLRMVAREEELKGWIWHRVIEMPEVELRRTVMPKTISRASVDTPERQADLGRLKELYGEGG